MAEKRVAQRLQISPQDTFDYTTPSPSVTARPVSTTPLPAPPKQTDTLDLLFNTLQQGIQSGLETYKIASEQAFEEGQKKALLGEGLPEKQGNLDILYKQRQEGYLKMKGRLDATTEYKRELMDIYNNNPEATPEELQAMINEVNQKYLKDMPDEYKEAFVSNALSLENQIVDSHLDRLNKQAKERIVAQMNQVSFEETKDIVSKWLNRLGFGNPGEELDTILMNNPDALTYLMDRNPELRDLMVLDLRANLSTLQTEGKKLGLTTKEVSELYIHNLGSFAAQYGLPELLDVAEVTDASGVALKFTDLGPTMNKYKQLAQERRDKLVQFKEEQRQLELKNTITQRKTEIEMQLVDINTLLASDDPADVTRAKIMAEDLRTQLQSEDTLALLGEDTADLYKGVNKALVEADNILKELNMPTDSSLTLEVESLKQEAATAETVEDVAAIEARANSLIEKIKNSPEYKELSSTTLTKAFSILTDISNGTYRFAEESDPIVYTDLSWKAQTGDLSNEELTTALHNRSLSRDDYLHILDTFKKSTDYSGVLDANLKKTFDRVRTNVINLFSLDPVTNIVNPTAAAQISTQFEAQFNMWLTDRLQNGKPLTFDDFMNNVVEPVLKINGKTVDDLFSPIGSQEAEQGIVEPTASNVQQLLQQEINQNLNFFQKIFKSDKKIAQEAGQLVPDVFNKTYQEINQAYLNLPPLTGDPETDVKQYNLGSISEITARYGFDPSDPDEVKAAVNRAYYEKNGIDYGGLVQRFTENLGGTPEAFETAQGLVKTFGIYLGKSVAENIAQVMPYAPPSVRLKTLDLFFRAMGYPDSDIDTMIMASFNKDSTGLLDLYIPEPIE